ncbi:uncharacterized protein [Sinocyclocheilus grahami]|uniref:uncharacterized protein n=1 Tax=Sinocyclocheilus grahami TaxID=75366 RepID=UPI0007AD3EB4|nr:PREDICTED: uncharacterized protein LOC107592672 [Sinocyclocheilus grahami]
MINRDFLNRMDAGMMPLRVGSSFLCLFVAVMSSVIHTSFSLPHYGDALVKTRARRDVARFLGRENTVPVRLVYRVDGDSQAAHDVLNTRLRLRSDSKQTVEKFFSKEIKYFVSSKPEARYAQRLLPDSPAPSPDSGISSPHPSSKRESRVHRGNSQGVTDTERVQMNGILANAVEWGVKVLHVDAERICRPFVKVEDSSRHYCPIYLPLSNTPVCNLRSIPPCCPFLMDEYGKEDPKRPKEQRVKCSTSTPVLCAVAMLPVKEDVGSVNGDWKQESNGSLLWSSTARQPLSEQTREKPLSVRKRSRGQCEFPLNNRDSFFDQSDVPEKSQSKRGSFEWEFHSQSVVRKSEGASFLSREQNCDSNAPECRTDQQSRTNPDMCTAQQFSERNRESLTAFECFRTNSCEVYLQSMPENQVENSALWPLGSTEPEPDPDSPTNSLQRKVRNVRSRRRKQVPALHIESSKERESLSSLTPVKPVLECENPPGYLLDLWQLFQSSDHMDEDFKGF